MSIDVSKGLASAVTLGDGPSGEHRGEMELVEHGDNHRRRTVLGHGYFVHRGRLHRFIDPPKPLQEIDWLAPIDEIRDVVTQFQNGRFNILVHDWSNRCSVLFNDRGGFLPLYCLRTSSHLYFASDYQVLRQIVPDALSLDPTGVVELFQFGYPIGLRTPYANVTVPEAGSVSQWDWGTGDLECTRVFPRHVRGPDRTLSVRDCARSVHDLMRQSCERLSQSDRHYAIKLSGGMDSRLIASSIDRTEVDSYTWGDRTSSEMQYAHALASVAGFKHHAINVEKDFHRHYETMHEAHGLMEFFHELAAELMISNGKDCNYDGMLGDVFFGGLGLNRIGRGDKLRSAVGIMPSPLPIPADLNQIVATIESDITVPISGFDVFNDEFLHVVQAEHTNVVRDVTEQIGDSVGDHESLDSLVLTFKLYNRTRRYIALQNAMTRTRCETLFPFLDSDLWDYSQRIPFDVIGNKKLFIHLYSHYYPEFQKVPAIMSGLPFTYRPEWVHYLGRIRRWLSGEVAPRLGKDNYPTQEATQWNKWFNENRAFRTWVQTQFAESEWIEQRKLERVLQAAETGQAKISGTKLMLSLSAAKWSRYGSL